eukprot:5285819-Pleurochrysis_carterae.AAC.1
MSSSQKRALDSSSLRAPYAPVRSSLLTSAELSLRWTDEPLSTPLSTAWSSPSFIDAFWNITSS